ncbi:STAS domain-containing protein [Streptomyces virginiae]|uniref:STAS domain-containing protein n=1 Tax=Streptomyces virginiae TaxID=1961 RepID=UPI00362D41F0
MTRSSSTWPACRFCDSSGLNALVQAQQIAAEHGRRISLRAPQPQVRRLLKMTGADALFPVTDSCRCRHRHGPPHGPHAARHTGGRGAVAGRREVHARRGPAGGCHPGRAPLRTGRPQPGGPSHTALAAPFVSVRSFRSGDLRSARRPAGLRPVGRRRGCTGA